MENLIKNYKSSKQRIHAGYTQIFILVYDCSDHFIKNKDMLIKNIESMVELIIKKKQNYKLRKYMLSCYLG